MLSDFETEKVYWSRCMNLKLAKFMEKRPHIWHPKHVDYTSVRKRDLTYAEFASCCGNEFTGQAVKARWTNIRSTFAYYLRKVKMTQQKTSERYKVKWPLWNACQFLLTTNKKLPIEHDTYFDVKEEDDSNDIELPVEDQSYIEGENGLIENNITNVTCQNIARNLFNVFKGVQNNVFGLDNMRNDKIGRTVAKKLSQMDSYEAGLVTNKIFEILLLYDANNPNNPNNNT